MDIKKLNEELEKFLELDINTIRKGKRQRKNNLERAEAEFQKAKEKLNNTPEGSYSVDPQTKKRKKAEKDFEQARDFQKLARQGYVKSKDLYDKKEKEYYDKADQKAAKFWELKDQYVEKITEILEKNGWELIPSERIYGFDVEYTYEKYYKFLDNNIYCTFNSDGPGGFYSIGFSVGSPKNEDWDECCLSNFIDMPKHPVYPEYMDHISLDNRYDGPTAENEWEQYISFVKNTLKILEKPALKKAK